MTWSLVPYLAEISLRRGALLFALILAVLIGGTWATINVTSHYVLNRNAKNTATGWATFLAANVTDLEKIAGGEQPSAQSLMFLQAARKAGQVFRYVIYNREGLSQFVSDAHGVSFVDISVLNPEARRAIATGAPQVDMKSATSPDMPEYFSKAFVPVRVGDRPVAVVAAFVDETARRQDFVEGIAAASVTLCCLISVAFGIPAIAWYRRTREKQGADRRIQFLAHHDVLTGLANRARLNERLDAALAVLPPTGAFIAVHYIDVDYFKQVNDTLGHDAGDFVLSTIGKRLMAMTRIDDMVARLGGDEFVIVQPSLLGKHQAFDFANRIVSVVGAPMMFNKQEIRVGCTIGIAQRIDVGAADQKRRPRFVRRQGQRPKQRPLLRPGNGRSHAAAHQSGTHRP